MELQQLCNTLAGCMSPDQTQRSAAEQILKQHETMKGQVVHLLLVAAQDSVDQSTRQVASIMFKNLVKRSWELGEGEGKHQIEEEDKAVVRENLLESMIRAPHAVQVQLGEVFKSVVYCDFPEKWPSLLPALYPNLVSQERNRVHGALYALRILTRKYEFRDEEERAHLGEMFSHVFPVLLHIFQQLLASNVSTPDVAEYMKLVCKTFWSATYLGIPDILVQQEQFMGWMTCLHAAVTKPIPPEVNALGPEEAKANVWWKAKKWVLHITFRLFNRYSTVKRCKDGNDKTFSQMYSAATYPVFAICPQRECMTQMLDAHLVLVANIGAGQYISPRCVNLLFQYLSHAIGLKPMYSHMKDHWDKILHGIAFPMMCFNDEDAELWCDDPHEYIRKGYDILEDMYSPKTAAANLAHELCSKKKAHLEAFMALIVQVFTAFSAKVTAGADPTAEECRKMDGALLAVGIMEDILKQKSPYKQQLSSMLMTFVIPCFKSNHGHLRAKACWVSGVFCDIDFAEGKGMGPTYCALFQHVVAALGDPELPVRVAAVVAIRNFVEEVEDLDQLKPILPSLLNSIFNLMNQVDNEDLVFTLEAIVEKFGPEIAPFAIQMATSLASAFWKYVNPDAADDEEEDEDDMSSIAAYGCLKALNTLLESVSSMGDLYPVLEESLFPIMQRFLSTEGQDVFEEVLEMMSYFTFYSSSISERMWQLWPQIHTCLVDWGIDYWENILVPLDNLISRDTARFLTSKNPDYLASVYQMVQHSLTGDYDDSDISSAPKLMEVVLQSCRGSVDNYVGPYLALVLGKLNSVKSRSLKDLLVMVVADALYYNAPLTMGILAQSAPGTVPTFFGLWFSMIFATRGPTTKPKHFRRMFDKKVCILGLVSLLACPEETLPAEIKAGMPQVASGLVKMLTQLKEQQEEMEKLRENEDAETEEEEEDEADWGADDDDGIEDEADEAAQEAYMKRLEAEAKRLVGGDFGGGDDDTDDEWTDDEETQTPIDPIDPFIAFGDALAHIQGAAPHRYQAVAASMDQATQEALQAVLAHAQKSREEAAARAAKQQA